MATTFRLGAGFDPAGSLAQGLQIGQRGQALQLRRRQQQLQEQQVGRQALGRGIQTLGQIAGLPRAFQKTALDQIDERFFQGGLGDDFKTAFLKQNEEEKRQQAELLGAFFQEIPGITAENVGMLLREDFLGTMLKLEEFRNRQEERTREGDIGSLLQNVTPQSPQGQAPAVPSGRGPGQGASAAVPGQQGRPSGILAEIDRLNTQEQALLTNAEQFPLSSPAVQQRLKAIQTRRDALLNQTKVTETQLALRAEQGDTQAAGALGRLREQRKASATQVNVGPTGVDYGEPPKDMVWARTAEGDVLTERDPETGGQRPIAIPIRGSKAHEDAVAGAEAKRVTRKQAVDAGNIVTEDINRVLSAIQTSTLPAVGPSAAVTSRIPGTAAFNVRALLDTIRANIGFDKLQQMRQASKTGGALGQVSERENALLQATMGSLEQSQSTAQFVFNLKRIYNVFLDTIHGPGNGPTRYPLPDAGGGAPTTSTPPSTERQDSPQQAAMRKRLQALGMSDAEINQAIGR